MKFSFYLFFWVLFLSFSGQAFARENEGDVFQEKPEIYVKIDDGTPVYIHRNKHFPCDNGFNHGGGCTRVNFYARMKGSDFTPDGKLKKITLQIGLKNIEVELSSELKKGSCLFDVVLKHELTHLALHRKILKRFAPEIAKAVLVVTEEQKGVLTQKKFDKIAQTLNDYLNKMIKEDKRQNALMDSDEAYAFQQRQCGGLK